MPDLKVGDIVTRNSYGGDMYFRIVNITVTDKGKQVYTLKGLSIRLFADSTGNDLTLHNPNEALKNVRADLARSKPNSLLQKKRLPLGMILMSRLRERPGRILHLDSDGEYLKICLNHYREAGLAATGRLMDEKDQPEAVRRLLTQTKADILVLTGHDSIKKGAPTLSMDSYRTSKYFVESVKEARRYQPSLDKLCICAGACQSYFEAIMEAGANFASSPGRVLINVLDPAVVSGTVAVTDSRKVVTPQEVAEITVSGSKGIGGIATKGHLIKL